MSDTTQGVVNVAEEPGVGALRRRHLAYRTMTVVLTAIVLGAVVDAATPIGIYGPHTEHAVATGTDGIVLDVRYGAISRPALATPFAITVTQPGGFGGQEVTVAVRGEYLALWDENGLDPAPAEETADLEAVYWTFEPPDGDSLHIFFDARIEPAAQTGEHGWVAVLDDDGSELVRVEFDTVVLP